MLIQLNQWFKCENEQKTNNEKQNTEWKKTLFIDFLGVLNIGIEISFVEMILSSLCDLLFYIVKKELESDWVGETIVGFLIHAVDWSC